MTPKHWCVRAAHEREEGVKTHRYAVLKGCRERDIVRRHSAVMAVMTSTPRLASHYRGEAVMRLSSQP